MGGVDEVVRERLCHVLVHCLMLWVNGRVVLATEKAEEMIRIHEKRITRVYWY